MNTNSNKKKRLASKKKQQERNLKNQISPREKADLEQEIRVVDAFKISRLSERDFVDNIIKECEESVGSSHERIYRFRRIPYQNIKNYESFFQELFQIYFSLGIQDELNKVIDYLFNETKILKSTDKKHNFHLTHIFERKERWIRDIFQWKPNTHNSQKQLISLTYWLFCKYYDVPKFMNKVWEEKNLTHIDWFIKLGNGTNIKKCNKLPVKLTNRQAHLFKLAPEEYSVNDAFRYAQIISLGGDELTTKAILGTKMAYDFEESKSEFIESVIRYFINNPMLDKEQYGSIVDYVFHQKYERVLDPATNTMKIAQPNLTMKDRNPLTLLKEVDAWHRKLNKEAAEIAKLKYSNYAKWTSCGIPGKEIVKENVIFSIIELKDRSALVEEGARLHHCVSSYTASCATKKSAIYSLRYKHTGNQSLSDTSLITIEINLAEKRIIQLRGLRNKRMAHPYIDEWAKSVGLTISTYA